MTYVAIFKSGRLIIVINKMDTYISSLRDDGVQLCEDDVVKDVQNDVQVFIQKTCKCPIEEIPKEVIIPLYGMYT